METVKKFSEFGEQAIIQAYFKAHSPEYKFLVDVGAYDVLKSNSAALIYLGWSGLLFEPHPLSYQNLLGYFKGWPVKIMNCAIGDGIEDATLFVHTDLGSSSLVYEWETEQQTGEKISVKVYPLAPILEELRVPKDFELLSVDAEGYDCRIMTKLLEESIYRPRMIITESPSYDNDYDLFYQHGYQLIGMTGNASINNWFFVRG